MSCFTLKSADFPFVFCSDSSSDGTNQKVTQMKIKKMTTRIKSLKHIDLSFSWNISKLDSTHTGSKKILGDLVEFKKTQQRLNSIINITTHL